MNHLYLENCKRKSYLERTTFKLYDDTIYTLTKLSENNNKLGIISNQERGGINILESNHLERYFEVANLFFRRKN